MLGKMGRYKESLEFRFGDPAVYAAQREEMEMQRAAIFHAEVKTQEQALSATYNKNRERIRQEHVARMTRFAREKPPRYLDVDHQTAAPPLPSVPQASTAAPAPKVGNARGNH